MKPKSPGTDKVRRASETNRLASISEAYQTHKKFQPDTATQIAWRRYVARVTARDAYILAGGAATDFTHRRLAQLVTEARAEFERLYLSGPSSAGRQGRRTQ